MYRQGLLVFRIHISIIISVRISVCSSLNIYNWHNYLKDYDIPVLCYCLEFGFLLNIDYNIFQFASKVKSHTSAVYNGTRVDKYFSEEVKLDAIVGPLYSLLLRNHIISSL